MKLIDAEKENERLLDFIAQNDSEIKYAIEHKDMPLLEEIFFEFFNEQPTVYDLDKVIEQAEINLKAACRRYDGCTAATLPVPYAEYRTQYKERKICLEIIKSGICQKEGVTDDE